MLESLCSLSRAVGGLTSLREPNGGGSGFTRNSRRLDVRAVAPDWRAAPRRTAHCSTVLHQRCKTGEDDRVGNTLREPLLEATFAHDPMYNRGFKETKSLSRFGQRRAPKRLAVSRRFHRSPALLIAMT